MATTNWDGTDAVAKPSGLIDSANKPVSAAPAPVLQAAGAASSGQVAGTAASQYQATLQKVDPGTTTQGNLDQMLKADSPYLQRAQAKASEISNGRGLLNSSMAAGAGTAAAIDAAAPIAQADAGIYANALTANQNAVNSAGQFNANQANQFGLADKSIAANVAAASAQQGYTQTNMATQQGFDATKAQQQAAITQNQMIAQQQNDLEKAVVAQSYNHSNMATQQSFDLQKLATQQGFQERLASFEQQGLDARQAREITSKEFLTQLEQSGVTNRFDKEAALKSEMFNAEQYNLQVRQVAENDAQLKRLGLQVNATQQNIPTTFAANISNTTMAGVNAILADGNIKAADKPGAIKNVTDYANAQISWAESFYKVSIPAISAPSFK